jgi:hypothetical protein
MPTAPQHLEDDVQPAKLAVKTGAQPVATPIRALV